ncbi:putative F-box only protein 22 [Apostichopus japonicus]|uniref:Putative F-box only protein 22 n=1 Tax=Stichopus japonicus TaxID=307972 RepID=A0A2G8LGN3_STIJA|nr:putative F-box only protein 22 [Apostichopus japonicus]
MENVRILQFSSTTNHSKELKKKYPQELMTEICGGCAADEVKCILLFGGMSHQNCQWTAETLQKAFYQELGKVPVIAGALVRKVKTTEPLSVGGLVFSGANVQAASVLLNEFVSTKADIKRQLAPLKNLNLEKGRRTIGFMFACIGRGLNHYCEENVESQVFREFFPETPLFGLFGNGEIGRENLTLMEDTKSYKLPEVVHGYTTVVVLISIK